MPVHSHQVLTATSPAAPGVAFANVEAIGLDDFSSISVRITQQGATGGTLNIGLWVSFDGGTTYYEWFRTTDITAAAAASTVVVHPHTGTGAPVATGKWTAGTPVPVLTKGAVAPGLWGSRMKVCFEAGGGTSAGAAQTIIVEGHRA